MLQRLSAAYRAFFALFGYADLQDEAQHFGLGHIAILCLLAPFAIDMSLYQFAKPENSTSWYETRIDRFMAAQAPVRDAFADRVDPERLIEGTFCGHDVCSETFWGQEKIVRSDILFLSSPDASKFIDWKYADLKFQVWVPPSAPDQYISKEQKINTIAEQAMKSVGDLFRQRTTVLFGVGLLLFPLCTLECLRRRERTMLLMGFAIPLAAVAWTVLLLLGFGLNFHLVDDPRIIAAAGFLVPKLPLVWLAWRGKLLARPVVGTIGLIAIASIDTALPEAAHRILTALLITAVGMSTASLNGWPVLARAQTHWVVRALAAFGLTIITLGAFLTGVLWLFAVYILGCVTAVLAGLFPVVVFALVLALLRLLVLAVALNAYVLRNLGLRRLLPVAGRSLLLWAPMVALAAPYFIIVERVLPEQLTDALNDQNLVPYNYPHGFRDNALLGTAMQFDRMIFQVHVAAERLKARVQFVVNQAETYGLEERTLHEFDLIMPTQLALTPVDSGILLGAGDKIGNAAEDKVQSSYKDLRATMRNQLQDSIHGYDLSFKASLSEEADNIKAKIDKARASAVTRAQDVNHDASAAVWSIMAYLLALHTLGLLIFAFVCIKSYMYVLARVIFHHDGGTVLTLGNPEGDLQATSPSRITPTGPQYVLPDELPVTFFVSRRFQCRGKAPRFAIPQPFHAPIARLLHRATTMNRIEITPGCGTVSCTATRGAQFIEWDLAPGEVVVFDFHNFVAMSKEVAISTLISPRLSTLLLGKFIFSTATGPGKLVLMTDGRAEITGPGEGDGGCCAIVGPIAESLPPSRLVAMHLDTRLHVESELRVVDVYLSDAYIRPTGGARVIVDVDSQRGSGSGLARFFLHFLWPG